MGTINWSENVCNDPEKAIVLGRDDKPKLRWCIGCSAPESSLLNSYRVANSLVAMCHEGGYPAIFRLWNEDYTEIGDENMCYPQELITLDEASYILARKSLPGGDQDHGAHPHILIPVALVASVMIT